MTDKQMPDEIWCRKNTQSWARKLPIGNKRQWYIRYVRTDLAPKPQAEPNTGAKTTPLDDFIKELEADGYGPDIEKGRAEVKAFLERRRNTKPQASDEEMEEAVGRAIVKEAWAIEGLPVKALTTEYKLLGRAAIDALAQSQPVPPEQGQEATGVIQLEEAIEWVWDYYDCADVPSYTSLRRVIEAAKRELARQKAAPQPGSITDEQEMAETIKRLIVAYRSYRTSYPDGDCDDPIIIKRAADILVKYDQRGKEIKS